MLLEHLGEAEAAKRVMQAIEAVTGDPSLHTGDLGGKATTAQVTAAVCALLDKAEVPAAKATT
jgi:tartrate dehydrogenase/decarboxylase/D-malate dehydrogenase